MSAHAAKDYYERYWRREQDSLAADPLRATRLRLLREALAGTAARRALDVGCGGGETVAALAALGLDATGMDVSERAVEIAAAAQPQLTFFAQDVETLPWPVEAESCDVVVSFEVIEHLLEPRRLLEGARDALRPGGHVALTTPYHGRLKNVALALAGFDRHFAVEGDHVRFFTDASLRRLLDETGFDVVQIRHFGRAPGLWAGVFVWARKR